ncbi:hypothetical protein K443DRAFT_435506 [Laccaria amethystina LaAM-08-1]|uniref:Uncharacterized protein n=1 Tax=Laccaria amethystina LaAM-08-1 TaxID=1095629 RepID=A0A0C9WI81_9AGAR|nr:hypothetical protein K443DRAFT_435506 [Laccaria amethystina LaAM-08-1]
MLKSKSFLGDHARRNRRPVHRPRETPIIIQLKMYPYLAMINFAPLSRGSPGTQDIRVSLNWKGLLPVCVSRHHQSKLFQSSFFRFTLFIARVTPHHYHDRRGPC